MINPDTVDTMYRASRPGHGPLTREELTRVRKATPADRHALVNLLAVDRELRPAARDFKRERLAALRDEALVLAHRLHSHLAYMDHDDPTRHTVQTALTELLAALRLGHPGDS